MSKLSVTVFATLAVTALVAAANVTGTWELESTFDDARLAGQNSGFDCVLKQNGERVTGKCSAGTAVMTGEVKGQTVTLRLSELKPQTTFTGTLDKAGTRLQGRFVVGDKRGWFTAVKQ
jgi:carbohydrate-selective porin OprB